MCAWVHCTNQGHHNSAQFLFCTFQLSLLRACFLASLTALTRRIGVPAQAMERRRQALPFLTRWRFQWHGGDVKFQSSHGTDVETKASWLGLWSQWNSLPVEILRSQIVPMCCVQTKTKKRWPIERDHWIAIYHNGSHMITPNAQTQLRARGEMGLFESEVHCPGDLHNPSDSSHSSIIR